MIGRALALTPWTLFYASASTSFSAEQCVGSANLAWPSSGTLAPLGTLEILESVVASRYSYRHRHAGRPGRRGVRRQYGLLGVVVRTDDG